MRRGRALRYRTRRGAHGSLLSDVKHVDDESHRRVTGSSNREILDNLRLLVRLQAAVRVRFPLVPGVNDDAAHVRRLAAFVASLGFREIDVVPYRRPVSGAYEALGRPNPSASLQEPPADAIAEVLQRLSECGLTARVVPRRV